MRLDLCEVPVIKVAGLLQICLLKHDDAATLIADANEVARGIELQSADDISREDFVRFALAVPVHEHPLDTVLLLAVATLDIHVPSHRVIALALRQR